MKKFMMMACAMIMALAANAREVNTVAFSKAVVNVPARVRFVKGDSYGFMVDGNDSVLVRSVQCSVKDGVLRFSFGRTVEPGVVKFDAKRDTYYYGMNTSSQDISDEHVDDQLLITVVSPEIPVVRTSSDYVAVAVKAVEEARKSDVVLTSNK